MFTQMVMLSDVYSERAQFIWLRDRLRQLLAVRGSDDELLVQFAILGIIKAHAVIGWVRINNC